MKKKDIHNLSIKKTKIATLKGGITDPCLGYSEPDENYVLPPTAYQTCAEDCRKTYERACKVSQNADCAPTTPE